MAAVSNPTLLAGAETSIQNTDNNPRAMDANVYDLEPNVAPLTVLTTKMGSSPAGNPKVEWLTDQPMPRLTTLSASALASATTLGVTADIFRVGDVARFSALGFAFLVTATGAGAITGTPIGTSTVSAGSGAELYLVGNANAEFGTMNEIKFPQLGTVYNYCQIFRTPLGLSETEQATTHYGGDERARLRKNAGIEHARKIEAANWFGIRSISTTTRTQNGLQAMLTTNASLTGVALTEVAWQAFMVTAFRYGSDHKVAYVSPTAASAIEGFARQHFVVNNEASNSTYGINMRTYQSGQGTVDIVTHKDWNDSATYGGYAFVIDMDTVKSRVLRATKLYPDIQAPDADGFKDEYRTEGTIQCTWEARSAVLTGITVGSY